jgi:hypothetical protein
MARKVLTTAGGRNIDRNSAERDFSDDGGPKTHGIPVIINGLQGAAKALGRLRVFDT